MLTWVVISAAIVYDTRQQTVSFQQSAHLCFAFRLLNMQVAVKRLRVLDLDDVKAPNEQYAEGGSGDSMRGSSGEDSQRAMGASQAAFRQFFEREIAILASIRHPNVVNFIGGCLLYLHVCFAVLPQWSVGMLH